MSDKAFEFRIGYWFEEPLFEDTWTLKEDTNLKTLYTQLCILMVNHIETDDASGETNDG